jgi:hypothetical protein
MRQATSWVLIVAMAATFLPRPARAQDAMHLTLFDLSPDEPAAREIAFDVTRALKKAKQARFRDLNESLNVGGEELQISAIKSGDGLVKSGKARLEKREWQDAADDFDNAVANYLTAYAHLPDLDAVPATLALLGVAHLLGGDAKSADAAFLRSQQADPRHAPDLTPYAANVQKAWDNAKKKSANLAKVDFEVVTVPPNAKVYVNGRFAGLSPSYVGTTAGEQFIAIGKQGWARKALVTPVAQSGQQVEIKLQPARRKQAADTLRERLLEIFAGAVESDDLTEAQGLSSTPYAVVLHATGTRDKMKVELALANLAGRQVVNRVVQELPWLKRDKEAIDKQIDDLLKPPDVRIETGEKRITTKSVFKTWWFWTILVAVGAGSFVAYKVATSENPPPPPYPPGHGGFVIEF